MRLVIIIISVILLPLFVSAKMVKDTLVTRQNDKIILTYDLSVRDGEVSIRFEKPRIIPSGDLRKACKGDLAALKVVLFDRVGDFGKIKWKGLLPSAFMVPSGLSYDKSDDGFYILGEATLPISFNKGTTEDVDISFPLYIAVYEKKRTYRLVESSSKPLKITIGRPTSGFSRTGRNGTETELIEIQTTEEVEADNEDVTKALSSIQMIRQLLESATEFPFSNTLQMEIFNLRSLRDRIKDTDVIGKINDVLLLCDNKERELKESQQEASLAAQAQEQALIAQQKAEEEARQKEAEEKARLQEEKQQKRTMWMIIGGVILAFFAFIGNTIIKHFRDIRNQKSIMEMQQNLAKQAQHEASRRSKEIVRNKAHQMANKGKSKVRESLQNTNKPKKNTKIKSI